MVEAQEGRLGARGHELEEPSFLLEKTSVKTDSPPAIISWRKKLCRGLNNHLPPTPTFVALFVQNPQKQSRLKNHEKYTFDTPPSIADIS